MDNLRLDVLYEVIKDWINDLEYVSISTLQRNFNIGFNRASKFLNYLIEDGYLDSEPTKRGLKVKNHLPKLKIYLLDNNENMVNEWKQLFKDCSDVEVVHNNFEDFMKSTDVSAVVSPGNSYGQMTGGYDLAITKYFGEELMKAVQRIIIKEHFSEQLVGTSIVVDIPDTNKKLIHVPTMKVPSLILDPMVIYSCMRATLMAALKNKIRTVVIPAFGGGCGKASHSLIALKMKEAYDQIKNHL